MTRAEEHLIMIGNAALLENVPTFERLIEFIKGKESYLDIGKERYVRGEFSLEEFN
jgi:superfamily I DNA and/or RNA helicase